MAGLLGTQCTRDDIDQLAEQLQAAVSLPTASTQANAATALPADVFSAILHHLCPPGITAPSSIGRDLAALRLCCRAWCAGVTSANVCFTRWMTLAEVATPPRPWSHITQQVRHVSLTLPLPVDPEGVTEDGESVIQEIIASQLRPVYPNLDKVAWRLSDLSCLTRTNLAWWLTRGRQSGILTPPKWRVRVQTTAVAVPAAADNNAQGDAGAAGMVGGQQQGAGQEWLWQQLPEWLEECVVCPEERVTIRLRQSGQPLRMSVQGHTLSLHQTLDLGFREWQFSLPGPVTLSRLVSEVHSYGNTRLTAIERSALTRCSNRGGHQWDHHNSYRSPLGYYNGQHYSAGCGDMSGAQAGYGGGGWNPEQPYGFRHAHWLHGSSDDSVMLALSMTRWELVGRYLRFEQLVNKGNGCYDVVVESDLG